MEHAIRIIAPGHEEWVSITRMLEEVGEHETRISNYVCPGEVCPGQSCRVPVLAAIPEEEKEGRKFVPRPYFRARSSSPHLTGCSGDSLVQVDEDSTATDGVQTVGTTSDARPAAHPVRFDERTSSVGSSGEHGGADGDSITNIRGGRSTGEGSGRQHTSERSTKHLSELVLAYKAASHTERARMPLRIRECPARNFGRAFRSVRWAVDRQGRPGPRYIYYGRYDTHQEHLGGISIRFAESAADGRPLSVWVEVGLGPATFRQALLGSLSLAQQAEGTAEVYVLGEFHLHREYKYTVEIPGLNYVWVSLPSNQQP